MPSPEAEDQENILLEQRSFRLRAQLAHITHSASANIALRTYSLALSLALGPVLVSTLSYKKSLRSRAWKENILKHIAPTSFPFAITVGVAGGALLNAARHSGMSDLGPHAHSDSENKEKPKNRRSRLQLVIARVVARLSSFEEEQKAFACNLVSSIIAILLIQLGYQRRRSLKTVNVVDIPLTLPKPTIGRGFSPTLDLTLLLLVRALDALIQRGFIHAASKTSTRGTSQSTGELSGFPQQEDEAALNGRNTMTVLRRRWTGYLDAATFWASSARIMWCFCYAPDRLPASYVKWINALANIDGRLIETLRAIRSGRLSYVKGIMPQDLTTAMATDMGCPPAWGDTALLPAYGGAESGAIYENLGVRGRHGLGGLPCELVHGRIDRHSCFANAARRGGSVFLKALLIYTPVQFLPMLLTKPQHLLSLARVIPRALAVAQSSGFLSTFVGSFWLAACLTRTVFLARLFPGVSHDFWDGPQGCVLASCLACGSSIFVESARRRGEIALYVLPRAVRASIPQRWLRSGSGVLRVTERVAFAFSLATLLTAGAYRPDTLRGMARWMMAFVMKGGSPKASVPLPPIHLNGSTNEVPTKKED